MRKAMHFVLALVLCVGLFAGCSNEKSEEQKASAMVLEDVHITAENVSPYEGICLEAGDEERVSDVYAIKFTNTREETIHSAQLFFSDGTNELVFYLEMLPAGKSVTVAEINKLTATDAEIQYIDGTVTYLEPGLESMDCVEVTGSSRTVQVRNTTDEALPLVRVFYRRTDDTGNLIGGPCYSFMLDGIEAGRTIEAEADRWDESCEVVTILVINE